MHDKHTHTRIHSYFTPTQRQWALQVDIVGAILSTRLETSISAVVVGVSAVVFVVVVVVVVAVIVVVTAAFVVCTLLHIKTST